MNAYIKLLLGFGQRASDRTVRAEWQRRTKNVCKPCWDLKYCPYGPLVEEFPLLPPTRAEAIEHDEFVKKQLAAGAYDPLRRKKFSRQVRGFDPLRFPVAHTRSDLEKSCSVFGHETDLRAARSLCSLASSGQPLG